MRSLFFLILMLASAVASSREVVHLNEPFSPLKSSLQPSHPIRIDGTTFENFGAAENPVLQRLILDSFTLIYSTPAAQQTLLSPEALRSDASLDMLVSREWLSSRLQTQLGVPFAVTSPIFDAVSTVKQQHAEISEGLGGDYVSPKRYLFLFNKPNSSFDSFTVEGNTTLIFVNEQTTRLTLLKILSHEIAISGDQKRLIGEVLYKQLAAKWGADEGLKHLPAAYRDPWVAKLFQVIRAYAFERQVMTELIPQAALLGSLSAAEARLYKADLSHESKCRAFAEAEAETLIAVGQLPAQIRSTLRDFWKIKDRTHSMSMCEYASSPRVRAFSWHTRGPRPRIGDTNGLKLPDLQIDLDSRRAKLSVPNVELQTVFQSLNGVPAMPNSTTAIVNVKKANP